MKHTRLDFGNRENCSNDICAIEDACHGCPPVDSMWLNG